MGIDKFRRIRERLQQLPALLETEIGNAIALQANEIEEMQREQLLAGRGKDGEKLEPKYKSSSYAKQKNRLNPEAGFGNPDLKKSGVYHRSITVRAYASYMEIDATDYKAKYLTPRYPNAIGLNILSVVRLQREIILPHLKQRVRSLL